MMREGDILLSSNAEGFALSKVLRITDAGDGSRTAHVLLYRRMARRPALADLKSAQVLALHLPINGDALETQSEVIGNLPVEREELAGYLEYLKSTNIQAYLQERGSSVEDAWARAKQVYEAGNALSDAKNYAVAIERYDEATAEFPLFFEALDNRAFALMDLARFEEAAAGFSESIRINPDNPVTLFSLGRVDAALAEWQAVLVTDPTNKSAQLYIRMVSDEHGPKPGSALPRGG